MAWDGLSPRGLREFGQPYYDGPMSPVAAPEMPLPLIDISTLTSIVCATVEEVIGDQIAMDQPLMEAGIDSLGATELQQKLADNLCIELPSTLVFDYPTIDAMVEFLWDKLNGGIDSKHLSSPLIASEVAYLARGQGVAMIAAAGNSFVLQNWRVGDGDSSTKIPLARWDINHLQSTGSSMELHPQFGVFMENVDTFDAAIFNIMRSEAVGMDPQQRLLLQSTFEALSMTSTGVMGAFGISSGSYVGIAATDYESLSHRNGVAIGPYSFTSAAPSVASGRLSYIFGMKGPAVSVDTACSASLVAAHMACEAFLESPMEMAVASGVLLCLVPESTLMLHSAQMLSPEGRSKTLDASADGYVRGEACRSIILKPMNRLQESDAAVTAILGSAVNTNGRASSLTAPHGPSQQSLLREAWSLARANPTDITGLQMHSNGTALGDPIEVGGVSAVALDGQRRKLPFLLATVKGYTGHQESAAGAVGLMEAGQIVQLAGTAPALHVRHINPHVHGILSRHPVSIARGGTYGVPSYAPDGRLAIGVSSFGAQGTNAHALTSGSSIAAISTTEEKTKELSILSWKKERCWVSPRFQPLLSSSWVRRRTKATAGAVTFETNVFAPPSAWLWDYAVYQRPHLPSSVLVSMLAGVPGVLDEQDGLMTTLSGVSMPAPLALPRLPHRPARITGTITIKARPFNGAVEIIFLQQKILTGGIVGVGSPDTQIAASAGVSKPLRIAAYVLPSNLEMRPTTVNGGTYSNLEILRDNDRGCFSLDPAVLESTIQHSELCMPARDVPVTWMRSLEALLLPPKKRSNLSSRPERASVYGSITAEENWRIVGSATIPSWNDEYGASPPTMIIQNMVLGEHDLPATSPGPASLSPAHDAEETIEATLSAEEDASAIPLDHPLMSMTEEERLLHLQALIMGEVRNVIGRPIHPEEPLMTSGLDSRGGMELRRSLAETLSMNLPVTLLYDYQSIDDIVNYINSCVVEASQKGREKGDEIYGFDGQYASDDGDAHVNQLSLKQRLESGAPQVSKLMKTLRPPPAAKPLFLAAPGVANAQSAYFAFSQYLQWSSQPIYVLDKDNDLNLNQLALQNAEDVVAIQPDGPYLIGGHSYGGAVAVEIAMVLESWGKEVGLVMVRFMHKLMMLV